MLVFHLLLFNQLKCFSYFYVQTEKHFSFPDFMLFGVRSGYHNQPDLLTAMGDHSEVDTCLMQSLQAFLYSISHRGVTKKTCWSIICVVFFSKFCYIKCKRATI